MLLLAAQLWLALTVVTAVLLAVVLTVGRVVTTTRRLRAALAPHRPGPSPRTVSSLG